MTSLPTLVFVPGAWHSPESYRRVIDQLEAVGYESDLVHLPSVGPAQHFPDFAADVAHIRGHIQRLVEAGKKVFLVVHSYGGIPSSEAVKGLDWDTRQRNGQAGGVVHLFYCCSFIVPEGESLIAAFGGNDLPWFNVSEDRLEVNPDRPDEVFYNDMSDEDVQSAVSALRPHSYQTYHSPCTYAAWKDIPTTYLYCAQDAAIPLKVQRMMVEELAAGYPIRTEFTDASHSPFYSTPTEVALAIRRAAGEEV
ncbi:alpha/beta-hydrolase [Aspergillus sclerotioniger CBS 115572]|uniref:Alpha/beta-hydrolase n=1 Tax=Aspergillus sclerotioniger CBS 115572 TaxID=1450535 RepID=A0A317XE69_9EURO|nr:alpha/beta-hydrolase [Aspergillus sclerotioniger CBS 115572]PWY96052.1 alpha/beta-hydrolase [Aspergillus sclerotioniger CBS 115572]